MVIGVRVAGVAGAASDDIIIELSIDDAVDICDDIIDESIADEVIEFPIGIEEAIELSIGMEDAIELSADIDEGDIIDDCIADDDESCATAAVASTAASAVPAITKRIM